MIERSLFGEEHDILRATVRRFVEREIVPFHAKWEEDGIVPRELWLKAGARDCSAAPCRRNTAASGSTICSTSSCSRNCGASARAGPAFSSIPTSSRPTSCRSAPRSRSAVAAEDGRGRGDRLARDDRTARRQRPQGDPDPGASRRRRFRDQRPEGLHFQRPAVRLRRARDQDRQPRRRQAASRCFIVESEPTRLQARPQSRKARHEGAGHFGTVLRGRPHARHQHARARRAKASR